MAERLSVVMISACHPRGRSRAYAVRVKVDRNTDARPEMLPIPQRTPSTGGDALGA